ncbi:MAG: LPS assembly lipoprotein LptE [Sphingomonadaceae bacterium]
MRWLVALLLLSLAGCQLAPVYSGGNSGPAAARLAAIEVAPILERSGFLVRDRLVSRLQPNGDSRYRLVVKLDDHIDGFGVRGDNSIIRERRTLRARYQLLDLESGAQLLDATAGADAGIDVVTSEYAVVAAETSALERLAETVADQIVARIALEVRQQP